METIFLKPFGGLGNRMLAINSAIILKADFRVKNLIVLWERNSELFAKFSEIFAENTEFKVKELDSFSPIKPRTYFQLYNSFHPSHYKYPLFNQFFGRERKVDKVFYNHPIGSLELKRQDIDAAHKVAFIAANNEFYLEETAFHLKFDLRKDISDRTNLITTHFDQMTIGVHIRRGDAQWSLTNSPDDEFVRTLKHLANQGHNFYLSSDDENTENFFHTMFRDFMVLPSVRRKQRNRNTRDGIIDAVIDLVCLSKTNIVYGSYLSTFGYLASRIGNIKFETVGNDGV